MFNKTLVLNQGNGPVYTAVTEKRAPTDQSVALLREMEKAARDEVDKTIRLETNYLKATIHYQREALSWDDVYQIYIDLNGKQVKSKVEVYADKTKEEKANAIFQEITRMIAEEIFNSLMTKDLIRSL